MEEISSTNSSSCDTWQPIVTNVLIILSILISVGKQFLNSNKHIKLNTNVDAILTGIKGKSPIMNTEGEGLIDLNIPEHLDFTKEINN